MDVRVLTLGGLRVVADGDELAGFVGQPVRSALLVHLALARETTRESVMALLWPERDGRRARHALSQTLYELRRTLGEDWIETRGDRLRTAEWIDADAVIFEAAARDGRYERALELYRGRFLEGWHLAASREFESWVDITRCRLAASFHETCRARVAECLAREDRATALSVARRWVEEEPLNSDAQLISIELLAELQGRTAAMRQYREYERRMRAEGLEPLEPDVLVVGTESITKSPRDRFGVSTHAIGDGERTVPRLVVLPFVHLGPSEDEYFTEGITDELTSRLAQLSGLAVIARTSAIRYRGTEKSIAEIGAELDVDYAIEGAVRWDRSNMATRVRISPQLIRVSDATHIWTETYEAIVADIFRVQTEVAERVADALDVQLRPGERREPSTEDIEANELYLRGLHHWYTRSKPGLQTAIELFQRALGIDPQYARAYAGLAQAYAMMPCFAVAQPREWHPQATRAAEKALELDPTLAEAHAARGIVDYIYHWNFEAAERHLRRSIELTPSYAPAHVWLAYLLVTTGRRGEAADTMTRAHSLDPLSVATNWDAGFHAWMLHDRDRAVAQFRRVLQLNPDFWGAQFMLGAIAHHESDGETARSEWSPLNVFGPLWQAFVRAIDDPPEAVEALDRWVELAPRPINWYPVATLYALLKRPDRALYWLEGHYHNVRGEPGRLETGGANLAYVATDPFYEDLRSEPRFIQLMERIGIEL